MSYIVKEKSVPESHFIGIRQKISMDRISQVMEQAFGELFGYLGKMGGRPAGSPFTLYHDPDFDPKNMDVEICVPVERPLSGNERIRSRTLGKGSEAFALHVGPYEEIGKAYEAVSEWVRSQGRKIAGPPRERYLKGPKETDPAELETEVAFPIE